MLANVTIRWTTKPNAISLPSNIPVGTVIYLQRVGGQTTPFNPASTIQISGSSGHLRLMVLQDIHSQQLFMQ
jgi:hypothetical protein